MKQNWNLKSWLAAGLFLVLLVCLPCVLADELYPFWEISGEYGDGYTHQFVYSDRVLLMESTEEVSPEMVKISMSLAAAAYKPDHINSMLDQMGYSAENFQFYERNINYNDLVAYTIGTRKIPESGKTAVIVAIRGSAQNAEWFSNFNVGATCTDQIALIGKEDHRGFHLAAVNVWKTMCAVVDNIPDEDCILLITGHSRGGAVANILGAWSNEANLVPENQMFVYTYACPNVSRDIEEEPYDNIHNFNITGDVVPTVPLAEWGYSRHGHSHQITAPEKLFQSVTGSAYTGASVTSHYERAIASIAPTAEDADDASRQFVMMALGWALGGKADVSLEEVVVKYLVDNHSGLIKKGLEESLPKELEDIPDAFEAGKKAGEATLLLVEQLKADTENMTPDEFEEYREKNLELYNEIWATTGLMISTFTDHNVVIDFLLKSIQYADEVGNFIGTLIFQLEDTGDISMSGFEKSILDAHLTPVYMSWCNQTYYGYRGGLHLKRNVVLPPDVLSVSPNCFESSEITSFKGSNAAYIGDDCFTNASNLETAEIPGTIEHLGDRMFSGCVGLTHLTLPIEQSVFNKFYCNKVKILEYTVQAGGVMPERTASNSTSYINTLEYLCRDSVEKIVYHEGVTEIAPYANMHYETSRLREVVLPSTLKRIGGNAFTGTAVELITLPEGLEFIGGKAFSGSFNLEAITIPQSVTQMGSGVFQNCRKLSDITILNHFIPEECFQGCSGLETMVIPNHVTSIGKNAFADCTGLTHITLPIEQSGFDQFSCPSVKTIEYTAQSTGVMPERNYYNSNNYTLTLEYRCNTSVEKIVYHEGVTEIAPYANVHYRSTSKLREVALPSTLKRIGWNAFTDTAIAQITLPEGLEFIGGKAFSGSFNLEAITIPQSVTQMDGGVFQNCTKLSDITILNSIIGNECFQGCSGLQTLVIPNHVTSIGKNAFADCTGLTHITLPIEQSGFDQFGCRNVKTIEYTAQSTGVMPARTDSNSTSYTLTLEYRCNTSVEKIVYHEGVTEIAPYANMHYQSTSKLREVALPSTLKKIGWNAFTDTAVELITLPEGLEFIGGKAFSGSFNLEEITIPQSVTQMGDGVFKDCTKLSDITILSSIIGKECFQGCSGLETLVIPNCVTSIGKDAFADCTGLTHITLPIEQSGFSQFSCRNVKTIEYTAQSTGVMPERSTYNDNNYHLTLEYLCRDSVEKIVYHEGVTEIAPYANVHYETSRLREVVLPSTLKRIGWEAFTGTAVELITLPEGLEFIGGKAFSGSFNLEAITIPQSVTRMDDGVFQNCRKLSDITILNSIIGKECFKGCMGLQTLVIPNCVTSIGKDAFADCVGLTHITLPIEQSGFSQFSCRNVKTIEYTAQSTGVMPERNYYNSNNYALTLEYRCNASVEKIVYHEGVTKIASYANVNYETSRLREVVLPSTLKAIGYQAFKGSNLLTMVSLGNKVESIDPTAFDHSALYVVCKEGSYAYRWAVNKGYTPLCCCDTPKLNRIAATEPGCVLPGLTEGAVCAHCGQTLLAQETVAPGGHSLHFAQLLYETSQEEALVIPYELSCGGVCGLTVHWTDDCLAAGEAAGEVQYPAQNPGARTLSAWIGENSEAAETCTVIVHASSRMTVPQSVTEVQQEAFAGISAVEIILPQGLQSIGPRAFAECKNLVLITIPDTVEEIAPDAFEGSSTAIVGSEGSRACEYAAENELQWIAN